MGDVPKKWLGCRVVEQSPKIRKKEDNVQEKWCLPCIDPKWCLHACIYGQAKREERGRGRTFARMQCHGDGGDFVELEGGQAGRSLQQLTQDATTSTYTVPCFLRRCRSAVRAGPLTF